MATITNTIRWATNTEELKRNLQQGIDTIDAMKKSVDRTAESLGGSGLMRAANNAVAAVQQLGGATKLTAAEQDRINAILTKTIEKYQVMGRTAPAAMLELAAATSKTETALSGMISKAAALAGGLFGAGLGATLIGIAKGALEDADALVKLHDKTGIGVEGLQRLRIAGDDAGNSLDEITLAVNRMQRNLAEGKGSAVTAIEKLGLNFAEIKRLAPDQQFMAIGDAIARIPDPAQQVALAMEIFGRGGAEILPTLKRGFQDVRDSAVVMGESTVKTLDDAGDAMQRTWRTFKAISGEMAAAMLKLAQGKTIASPNAIDDQSARGTARSNLPPGAELLDPTTFAQLHAPLMQTNADIKALSISTGEAALAEMELTASAKDSIEVHRQQEAALRKAAEASERFRNSVQALSFKKFVDEGIPFVNLMKDLSSQSGLFREHLDDLDSSVNEFHGGITIAGDEMQTVTIPSFAKLADDVVPKFSKEIAEARGQTTGFAAAFKKLFAGDFASGLSGIASSFKNALDPSKIISGLVTAGLTSAINAGIGLIGRGLSALFHLGKPSQEELNARKTQDDLVKQLRDMATGAQRAEGAFDSTYKTIAIVGRDAFLKVGMSAAEADRHVSDLLNTHDPRAFADGLSAINQVLNDQQKDAADLDAAIQRYGFSIEQLGPAMQKQKLDDQAHQLMNDWRLLVGSGIDIHTVTDKMSGAIEDYFKMAMKTGTEIPAAMKPILEQMVSMGTLTDASGNKIEDLSQAGVTFAETMTQGFDRVVDKLTELITKLGLAGQAIAALPDATVTVNEQTVSAPDTSFGSHGGLVTAAGIVPQYFGRGGRVLPFRPNGTDTVPAMLTPNEEVLSVAQKMTMSGQIADLSNYVRRQEALANATADGGTPVEIHSHIHVGNKEIAEQVLEGVIGGGKVHGQFTRLVKQVSR